ncbi:MAG: sugar ABC transporter substrate-binding protein [Mycobacteriales bacterium]
MRLTKKRAYAATLAGASLVISACGSSGGGSAANTTPTGGSSSSSSTPSISATSFTQDFSAMAQLSSLASQGKGSVGVILPDTDTSSRYQEFDAPLLKKAFTTAGLSASQISIKNAQHSDTTFVTDAQAMITNGATVLLIDPEDPGTGKRVAQLAQQHGVAVIDYDRITQGSYYISFDNVKVGQLIGQGFAQCVKDWNVSSPNLIEMAGDPTDNNATLFKQGYDSVIKANPSWKVAATPAGTWTPNKALTEFEGAYTSKSGVNSAIIPNDENAGPIINYLRNKGVKAKTFPITGQDATLQGLQNILAGYQCGTAYKPIYLEAQAAAAVALYVRAGKTPPAALVNGQTANPNNGGKNMPSVLLTPQWVTAANMESTVVKDNFVPAKQICTAKYQSACQAAGIS